MAYHRKRKPTCCKCGQSKGDRARSAYCAPCARAYAREHYRAHREQYQAKRLDHQRAYRRRNRAVVRAYLATHPCADCGESDPDVLEFDHARHRKSADVSRLVSTATSLDRLRTEMSKCDVVCCNCHRKRTLRRRGS